MSDQKDPGIKLFGRVIPWGPEPAPGTTEAEDPPPDELQPRAPDVAAAVDEVSLVYSIALCHSSEWQTCHVAAGDSIYVIGGSISVTRSF